MSEDVVIYLSEGKIGSSSEFGDLVHMITVSTDFNPLRLDKPPKGGSGLDLKGRYCI